MSRDHSFKLMNMHPAGIKSGLSGVAWYVPLALLAGLVFVYPVLRTVGLSFFHQSAANGFRAEFVGLANFQRLADDSRLINSLRVTTIFTIVSVALEFTLGLVFALAANRLMKGQDTVRTILLIPWTLPTAVIAVLWAWIFNDQFGIINAILVRLKILSMPFSWLATAPGAMAAAIIADVWKTVPFVFIILLAGIQSIPSELYEAIEIDGGGSWAKFRFVTWPLLSPFAFIALIFRAIQAFAIFDLVYVMTGGGPGGGTETVSIYVYQTFMRYLDFGYGSAMAVAMVVLFGAFAAALYRLVVRES
jgi:multiple sugar transport system permease protein